VKEQVYLPWNPTQPEPASKATKRSKTKASSDPDAESPSSPRRVVHEKHFTKALTEITPSSSESLGTLADLRKWNEEFGEGRSKKGKKRGWGDKFGFGGKDGKDVDGRVLPAESPAVAS
jgi:hypothetical protein